MAAVNEYSCKTDSGGIVNEWTIEWIVQYAFGNFDLRTESMTAQSFIIERMYEKLRPIEKERDEWADGTRLYKCFHCGKETGLIHNVNLQTEVATIRLALDEAIGALTAIAIEIPERITASEVEIEQIKAAQRALDKIKNEILRE